jgi:hypothetical protein
MDIEPTPGHRTIRMYPSEQTAWVDAYKVAVSLRLHPFTQNRQPIR